MDLAAGLDRALQRAGIPIVGVTIGNTADRGSWRVLYAAHATDQQRTDGAAILASYTPETDTAGVNAEALAQFDNNKMLKALGLATAARLGVAPNIFRAEVIAAYKALP